MSSELKEMNTAEAEEEIKEETETAIEAEENASETAAPADNRDYELRVTDEDLARKKKIKEIWDKFTTGLLIFLMASPILILAYIFIWFLTK